MKKRERAKMWEKAVLMTGFCVCASAVLLSGCRTAPASVSLADRFRIEGDSNGNDSFAPHFSVTRNGMREDSVRLVAPVAIRTELAGYEGRCVLKAQATPVFNIGDGLQLDIFQVSRGGRRQIYARYFDSARIAADRNWIPLEVPFEVGPEGEPHLEIRISGGPQGDLVADWLALARLRITSLP